MNRPGILALIEFVAAVDATAVPVVLQARLPGEEESHPFGHRSARIRAVGDAGSRVIALLEFLDADDVPRAGTRVDLFRGRRAVGTAIVQVDPNVVFDTDIVGDRHRTMRSPGLAAA